MRSRSFVSAALTLVFAVGSFAVAQEASTQKAPFNPYSTAKKGDWATYVMTIKGEMVPPEAQKSFSESVIEKVEGDQVTVRQKESNGSEPNHHTYPAKGDIDIATLIDAKDKKIEDVKISDEKKTVGGKEFACSKIVCKMSDKEATGTMTFWASKDVKAGGLVAADVQMKMTPPDGQGQPMEFSASMELQGYGSEGKTEFGKTLAELAPAAPAKK